MLDALEKFDGRCLPFDELAAIRYGAIFAHRIAIGQPINVPDAQIASIALMHGLQLATRNTRDFENIPSLELFNPWLDW